MIPWDNICKKKQPLMQFYVHLDWPDTDNLPGGSTGEEIGKYNKLCPIVVTMVWRHIVFDLPVCSTKSLTRQFL